jgi:hypothetical protein
VTTCPEAKQGKRSLCAFPRILLLETADYVEDGWEPNGRLRDAVLYLQDEAMLAALIKVG